MDYIGNKAKVATGLQNNTSEKPEPFIIVGPIFSGRRIAVKLGAVEKTIMLDEPNLVTVRLTFLNLEDFLATGNSGLQSGCYNLQFVFITVYLRVKR